VAVEEFPLAMELCSPVVQVRVFVLFASSENALKKPEPVKELSVEKLWL